MAFDQDAELFDVLASGYQLNTRLQALLGHPLDSHGQQEALALSQELSRLFKVSMSMFMLNSNTVTRAKTAPEIRTGNSSGVLTVAAKDKRARSDSREVVTPMKKSREGGVIRKEITPSPHEDGYDWRKYGQKHIQNCNFVRYYFRCSRDRRCEAKKKVQQQDDRRGLQQQQQQQPPLFEVTYVNDHTCHVLRAIANDDAARMASARTTTNRCRVHGVMEDAAARNDDGDLYDLSSFPCAFGGDCGGGGGSARENETIVSCLATVISGAVQSWPPPPAAEAGAGDHAAYVPLATPVQAAGHWAGVAEDGATMVMVDADFSWDPSSFCPVEEADRVMVDDDDRDVHVDVARLADTVWPRHTCAWR